MSPSAYSFDTFCFLTSVLHYGIKEAIALSVKLGQKYQPALRALRAAMNERGRSYTKRNTNSRPRRNCGFGLNSPRASGWWAAIRLGRRVQRSFGLWRVIPFIGRSSTESQLLRLSSNDTTTRAAAQERTPEKALGSRGNSCYIWAAFVALVTPLDSFKGAAS
jgi:hypothetical protein